MPEAYSYYSHHEALTWRFIRERIGQDLREHYQVPAELPSNIWALVVKLEAVEGDYVAGAGPPSL
jgi:hypothetical protein